MTEVPANKHEQDAGRRYSADPDARFTTLSVERSSGEVDPGWIAGDIISLHGELYAEVHKQREDGRDIKKTVLLGDLMALNTGFSSAAIERQYGVPIQDILKEKTAWDNLGEEAGIGSNPWAIENYDPQSQPESPDPEGQGEGVFNSGVTPVENPGPMAIRQASQQPGSGVVAHGSGIFSKNNEDS